MELHHMSTTIPTCLDAVGTLSKIEIIFLTSIVSSLVILVMGTSTYR